MTKVTHAFRSHVFADADADADADTDAPDISSIPSHYDFLGR